MSIVITVNNKCTNTTGTRDYPPSNDDDTPALGHVLDLGPYLDHGVFHVLCFSPYNSHHDDLDFGICDADSFLVIYYGPFLLIVHVF